MHVVVNTADLVGTEVPISTSAADLVRMRFAPPARPRVLRVKALAAALISEIEAIRDADPAAARAASVAITAAQDASMWAVHAATEGL
jgi:hypothetical protein